MSGTPTPVTPIDAPAAEITDRITGPRVRVDDALEARLRDVCAEVSVDDGERAEAGRDWWPLAIRWAVRGSVPARPAVVVRPTDAGQVAGVLAACHDGRVPVTAVAGRSGVCGSSVPLFGGVSLDLCAMAGIVDVDTTSLLTQVLPGTFGPDLEADLRTHAVTLGHWPQSMALSTVGGWVACRGAGQYSTRYGKIEDMVTGLEVALADGRVIRTGGAGPRAALGPDLSQLFVGSEGTLGVITEAQLRLHPVAPAEGRRAYSFTGFGEGLEVCRRILRRGATPAVLRLYDQTESARNFELADQSALVVLDEADEGLLGATLGVVDAECAAAGARPLDEAVVERWVGHKNDVSALAPLYRAGIVVDTIEIAARWSTLPGLYETCVAALLAIEGTLAASAHQSHAYVDGACLYFTFAGRMPEESSGAVESHTAASEAAADAWAESYYTTAWRVVMDAVRAHGGAISHHHGVGINRGRFLADALGGAFDVLVSLKEALDPRGILNPGKLGLPSPFGEARWP
ncbi:MAG TPA: FAD-binding oxidoreductase [Acidimicrobiales bacterium]|nr:FAD-binding oxidoreductase [Acidimicrobiales bacterium]